MGYQQNPQPTSAPVTVNVPVPQQCHTQYVHHSYPAVPTQNNYYHSYPTVQTENPGYSNADVTSHLGKMWRSMRKEQREKYVQRSRAISQKFKKENPRYIREPKEFEQYQFSFKVQSQGATKTIRKKSPVRQTPPTYQQNPQPTSVPVTVNVPVPQQCHTQYVHHSYP